MQIAPLFSVTANKKPHTKNPSDIWAIGDARKNCGSVDLPGDNVSVKELSGLHAPTKPKCLL